MADAAAPPQIDAPHGAAAPRAERAPGRSHRLRLSLTAKVGVALTAVVVLIAIIGPLVAPYPPDAVSLTATYLPPSAAHWFGTDDLGRDVFSRVLSGVRVSVFIGLASVLLGAAGGTLIGLVSGYFRALDGVIMRLIDILLAFPGILLALVVVATFGPGITDVIGAAAVFTLPTFARLARSSTLVLRETNYVEAARAMGASNGRILFRTIFPNSLGPLIVQCTLRIGAVILLSAGLSFLGLGIQPPTPDLGAMVSEGQVAIYNAPWISLFPGATILFIVIAFNLLGDWVLDIWDPTGRSSVGGV